VKELRTSMTGAEVKQIIDLWWNAVYNILQSRHEAINTIIKSDYPDVYERALELHEIIKNLKEKWLRNYPIQKWEIEFDGMAENAIITQLTANTLWYLHYLVTQYSDEEIIDIRSAPAFWHFSANFW
jgi:hypothetical protein